LQDACGCRVEVSPFLVENDVCESIALFEEHVRQNEFLKLVISEVAMHRSLAFLEPLIWFGDE